MYTLETILEKLRAHKPKLQRKYPVSHVGVFGSYARGDATSNSDIDIAVEITGTTILFRLFEAPIPHQAFS
jgi:predicted nucleotidyltransferase